MEFPSQTGETVLAYVRPTRPIYRESSLSAALDALRESSTEMVPVLDGPYVAGVIWGDKARVAALSDLGITRSIAPIVDTEPPRLSPNTPLEDGIKLLVSTNKPSVVVADTEGRYLGTLSALDLFHRPEGHVRPPFIGGMATPFGVFLTNGEISGGAKPIALALTGALLFGMLMIAVVVTTGLIQAFGVGAYSNTAMFLLTALPPALFFTFLRAIPLSGTHGAEHMVVHAIERREPLTLDVVGRMPRVHPRCGTNFAIGAIMFTGLIEWSWPRYHEVGALLSLVVTLIAWRPVGSLFQKYVTTKQPNRQQLEGAIRAGEELLAKYRASAHPVPGFLRRLAMSGMPYVLFGSIAAYAVVYWFLRLFAIDPGALGLR